MVPLILFLILAYAQARIIANECNGVIIDHINHEQEVLKDHIDSPYQLAIDYDTNVLFFSYSSPGEDDVFKSAYINLKNNEFQIIRGVPGGFANAVDNYRHIVYIGGYNGIYKFDFYSKIAKHTNDGVQDNIWQMFFKDDLYYTTYPDEETYIYRDGKATRVPELSDVRSRILALDNNKNIYYCNSSGLFVYNKEKKIVDQLGDYNINGFTADIRGNLYFSTPSAIYSINENQQIKRLAVIDNVYGLAVEGDGTIIYAALDSLIRLKSTNVHCFVDEKKL